MRALSLLLLLAAPAAFAQTTVIAGDPADVDAIVAQSRALSEAYMRGDTDALVAVYATDGIAAPSGSDFVRGYDALADLWQLPPGRVITHHQAVAEELWISVDLAYDWGYYEGAVEQDGEPRGSFRGKYLIVWQRDADGVWRIANDMWNSLPSPPPTPSPLEGAWVAEAFGGEIHEQWETARDGSILKAEGFFVMEGDTTYSETVSIGAMGGARYLVAHPSTGGTLVWDQTGGTATSWTFENPTVANPTRIVYAFHENGTFTRTLTGPSGETVLRFRRH